MAVRENLLAVAALLASGFLPAAAGAQSVVSTGQSFVEAELVAGAAAPGRGGKKNIQEAIYMNWDQIEGNWKQVKGKAKEQWGKLTDDDLDVISGKRDQLVGKLQERYGYSKEQAEKLADDWSSRH